MNKTILRALMQDALYQVLDNKVFRLLIFLTAIPVLFSFLVGFQEEQIVFFFGYESIDYNSLLKAFGAPPMEGTGFRIRAIQGMQAGFTELLAGNFGISMCIAATAFFVPRMLEKGTADNLFSKPLSRATLLLARYVSGILFVLILSTILIVGVHLGLLVSSGYSDPGFLWGILTLTYIYALVQSFSVCVAALTRSSVAAILCALMFFWFTGCTHSQWYMMQQRQSITQVTESPSESDNQQVESSDDAPGWVKAFVTTFDIIHYALPKTTDADALTGLLRQAVESEPYEARDETGGLRIGTAPSFGEGIDVEKTRSDQDDFKTFDLSWAFTDSEGEQLAFVQLTRLYRRYETLPDGTKGAKLEKALSSSTHRRVRPRELKQTEGVTAISDVKGRVANRSASFVQWAATSPNGTSHHEEVIFGFGAYTYLIETRWKAEWLTEDEREQHMSAFMKGLKFPELQQTLATDNDAWLEGQLSFSAPLKYNIFFSIGSSIAFALSMLFISWLALRRINF